MISKPVFGSTRYKRGFTIIELLVVFGIIGILVSITLITLNSTRTKTRDVTRLAEMRSTKQALDLYYIDHKQYPNQDGDGCGGWDVGNQAHPFFNGQGMDQYFNNKKAPIEQYQTDDCSGYRYYRYAAGDYGCPVERGAFYVVGVGNMETSGNPFPGSPGFSCPGRNWQDEFDWVTGAFEN